MKLLLTTLNSKYVHSSLALRYLYESAGAYQKNITVREFSINQDDISIYMEIMRGGYDVICFSCYIWNISRILELIRDLKKARPQVRIVVGGPEVTFEAQALLERCPQIDLILQGEGERSFRLFLERLLEDDRKDPWEDRMGEKKIWEPMVPLAEEIPFPYRTKEPDPTKITYYESSRGCPYRCSFCISSTTEGIRFLPLDRVKRELDFFLEKKVRQVKLIDRTFNADPGRAAEILQYLVDRDNGVTNFHLELCGDRISEEMMEAFEEARNGLFQLEIGVQSTLGEALLACGRHVDFHTLSENVKRLVSLRTIHVHLDLIAGLPFETFRRFQQSFDDVYRLQPDDLQLGFLKMIKGSRIRKEAALYGYEYRDQEPYEVISSRFLSAGELVELKQVEHVLELYYNKPGFRNTLAYLISHYYDDSPFAFYHQLAEYYFCRGWHSSAQPRARLYDFFLSFIREKKFQPLEGLEELLLYDRIATAPASSVTEKAYGDLVHEKLHEMFRFEETIKVKDLIKKINYHTFTYNVSDWRYKAASSLEKEENTLCIFFADRRDAGGMAAEMCLPVRAPHD